MSEVRLTFEQLFWHTDINTKCIQENNNLLNYYLFI